MITVDLNKVISCRYYYRNQLGMVTRLKPKQPSVNGQVVDPDALVYRGDGESMLSLAKRLGLLDVWTPVVTLHQFSRERVQFTGDRAKALWKEYNAKIFGKRKRKL